jgi:hypothetical protein
LGKGAFHFHFHFSKYQIKQPKEEEGSSGTGLLCFRTCAFSKSQTKTPLRLFSRLSAAAPFAAFTRDRAYASTVPVAPLRRSR